jgi:hypothetical protein
MDSETINRLWWGADKTGRLRHAVSAVCMVSDLPEHIVGGSLPDVVQVACVEAFFLNARLVIEFLTRKDDRDFSAWSYVPDWKPVPEDKARLETTWDIASKHIVHFSEDRKQDPARIVKIDISREGLGQIVADIDAVWTPWVEAHRRLTARDIDDE